MAVHSMDKKLIALMSLFFVAFLFFTTLVVFKKPLSTITRAENASEPSSTNSLLFAWPLSIKADKTSTVKIDVFVRSATNAPLENKTVKLSSTLGSIRAVQDSTDKGGKATFILTSETPGMAEITGTINQSTPIAQKLSIKFE